MPYTDIFVGCNASLAGVKHMRLCAKKNNGEAIAYPLDVVFTSGSTDTIIISENFLERLITINGQDYIYRMIMPNYAEFNQEITETRQGILYKKDLVFTIPKVTLTTNNQIREFFFGQGEQFAVSNIFAYITDMNHQDWIVGWDLPLVLEEFDLKTDYRNADNSYVFKYVSESYLPALKIVKT